MRPDLRCETKCERFLPGKNPLGRLGHNVYSRNLTVCQMARELGLNPKKFGSLANTKQEPQKVPLSEFIEERFAPFLNDCLLWSSSPNPLPIG
jgi:hypothetical protein